MKTRSLTILAALVAAVAVALSGGYAIKAAADESALLQNLEKETKLPDINKTWSETTPGYLSPGNPQKSCGGDLLGPTASVYYFGYKRPDGFCMTREVLANSANEAWMCARSYCSNCRVEDITGSYRSAFSGEGTAALSYCPINIKR